MPTHAIDPFRSVGFRCATSAAAIPVIGNAFLVLLPALPAQAGSSGTITFAPATATAIPALGGSLLLVLAALLALIAVKAYRRTGQGIAPVLAGALALGSLLSIGGGIELMQRAHAKGPTLQTIADPEGG